jgi:hypothetical protein
MTTIYRTTNTNSLSLFLFELPFWLSLAYWSFLPDTQTPKVEIASIPVNIKDLALIAVACLYLLLAIKNYCSFTSHRSWHWHCHLPILTAILLFYAALSMEGSGMDADNTRAMTYTLILTASAFFLGYNLLAKRSTESVRSFLWRLTVFLAGLGLVYSAASIFSLGMGDVRAELNAGESDFGGILRVRGPLFGASTGHFILVPALAFSIQEFIQSHTRRLFKFAVVMAITLTIIGLGSRAALIVICTFFVCLFLFMRNKKKVIIIVLITFSTISMFTIFSSSKTETSRLGNFEDSSRSDTHLTSFQIIIHRAAELNITGSGYGSYWPWYLIDMDLRNPVNSFDGTPSSLIYPFSYLLYHPHSTFLLFIVELGIPGLIYFATLWIILVRLLFRNYKGAEFPVFNSGVFASGFSMFFDFFIFKGVQINALWWIYLLGALALDSSLFRVKLDNNNLINEKNIQGENKI